MDNPVTFKKRFFSLRDTLSKEITERFSKLAENLAENEYYRFKEIMRRAAGNSLPEPTDINETPFTNEERYYERLYSILEPHFENEKKKIEFVKRFVIPLLEEKEKGLLEYWKKYFIGRISQETIELFIKLGYYTRDEIVYINNEIDLKIFDRTDFQTVDFFRKPSLLSKPSFETWEKEQFQPLLQEIIEREIKGELKEKGLPIDVEENVIQTEQGKENVFRKKGDVWEIKFNGGDAFFLTDTLGLSYIFKLLSKPKQIFTVYDLIETEPKTQNTMENLFDGNENKSGEFEYEVSEKDKDNGIDSIDKQTIEEIRKKLHSIALEKRDAERDNDLAELNRLDEEVAKIEEYLGKSHNKSGKIRQINSFRESARVSVTQTIKRALDKIKEQDVKAHNHLDSNIQRGINIIYNGDLVWKT